MKAPVYRVQDITLIQQELGRLNPVERAGALWICCPFHEEKTPSCKVNITENGYPYGSFYCFGCKAHGGWNALAEKAGLKKIWKQGDSLADLTKSAFTGNNAVALPGQLEFTVISRDSNVISEGIRTFFGKAVNVAPWPVDLEWRKIRGDVVRRAGGLIYSDRIRKEARLWLPVRIFGREYAGIHCLLEKGDGKHNLSYVNDRNEFSRSSLFPFDLVARLLHEQTVPPVLFLVEGPRDALNMIQLGFAALSVLGSYFSPEKRSLLDYLSFNRLVMAFDSDMAGYKARRAVHELCSGKIPEIYDMVFQKPNDPADLIPAQIPYIMADFVEDTFIG